MATSYPTSLDSLTNPTATDPVTNPSHATQHANANDALEALEAKVGVDSSAVTTSIDYLLKNAAAIDPGHLHTSAGISGQISVAKGGTGASTLTGILLGNGASAITAITTSAALAAAISDETGSGALVFANTPTLVTPILGVASATSINKVAITAPATSATLTIANGKTITVSNTLTFTGTDTSSVAFGAGGTVAYTGNKLDVFAATTSAELKTVISDETGSGSLVFADTPTLVTPVLGAATATSINGLTITSSTGTLTITNGKTLTSSNTLAGTDGKVLTLTTSLTVTTNDGTIAFGAASKTLTVSDSTTLATNSITFAGTEVLTLAATKSVTFADAFITSGANSLTLTTTGTTNVTLPTTGTLATLAGTETLSGKTLTAPKIVSGGFIADANGNELIIFTTTASAVNELTIANGATGVNPTITASGETNVGLDFQAKGTGVYRLLGTASQAAELRLYEDTDNGTNYSAFKVGSQAANITYTLPTAVGAAGTYLKDAAGDGVLSWASAAGAAAVPKILFATCLEVASPRFTLTNLGSGTSSFGANGAILDFSGTS